MKTNNRQIRLLIPSQWVEELDALASLNQCTRLALIRKYLRQHLDKDLSRVLESRLHQERMKRATIAARELAEELFPDY